MNTVTYGCTCLSRQMSVCSIIMFKCKDTIYVFSSITTVPFLNKLFSSFSIMNEGFKIFKMEVSLC